MNIKIVKLFTCGRGSYQLLFVQEQFRTISNQVLMKTTEKHVSSMHRPYLWLYKIYNKNIPQQENRLVSPIHFFAISVDFKK